MSRFYARFNQEDERWEVCDTAGGIVGVAATGEAAQGEADRLNLGLEGEGEYQEEYPEPDDGPSPGF